MDLVVARPDLALVVDHEAAIDQLAALALQRQRTEMDPNAAFRSGVAHGRQHLVLGFDPRLAKRPLAIAIEHARTFPA